MKTKAKIKRFFHCLFNLHRMVTISKDTTINAYVSTFTVWSKQEYIGCECGKVFYSTPKGEILIREFKQEQKNDTRHNQQYF